MKNKIGNLVLHIKVGQRVKIGDDVIITLIDIGLKQNDAIRLGFEAPTDISIKRHFYTDETDTGLKPVKKEKE
jgi:carbon storage regulator CsrA